MSRLQTLGFTLLSTCLITLTGCGSGAGDGSSKANSFPPTSSSSSATNFSNGSTSSGTSTSGLSSYQLRVTVQLPKSIVPDGTPTHRNLNVVQPSSLRVVQVSQDMIIRQSFPFTQQTDTDGSTILTFDKNEFPSGTPLRPDILVEADVSTSVGTITVSAPAANETRDVLINPFSEYLVKKVFSTGFSASDLSDIDNCIANQTLCVSELLWPALSDQVQSFEIDIPNTMNEDQAVSYLGTRVDFTNFINGIKRTMVENSSTTATTISASSVDFNALVFGTELDQAYPSSNTTIGQWGVRSSTRVRNSDTNGSSYAYPGTTLASFALFGFNVNSIGTDVPYQRGTLQQQTDGTPTTNFGWQINTHSAEPGSAGIVSNSASDAFLLASRAQLQSITTENAQTVGWSPNPYFFDGFLYGGASSPSALAGSYFHSGKAIQLLETSGSYERQRTLEDMYTADLEFNIAKPDANASPPETVTPSTLSGNYNAISYTVSLNEGTSPLRVATTLHNWQVSSGVVSDTTAPVQTTVARDNSNTAIAPSTTAASLRTWNIGYGVDDPNGTSGRLSFTNNSSGTIEKGAATVGGSLAGFMIANTNDGDGLLIAMKKPSTTPNLTSKTYKLQGVSVAINSSNNILNQYSQSTIVFDNSGNATLTLNGIRAVHTLSTQTVSSPETIPGFTATSSSPVTVNSNGEAKVSFADGSGTLSLDGYVSPNSDDSLLILSLVDSNNQEVGLLFGYRQ